MDNTCCGYCYAPDHIVPPANQAAIVTDHQVDLCESADSACHGPGRAVMCFRPSCGAGETPHCGGGRCCATCMTR
eukprot:NODE_25704_length_578_cov_1.088692.p4 GENE.NODE_25704_length_578_cov_1.088692~~NODE_25704_length_578_cov_1.088692.p4  ORF type:complete len:75 (+),score=20.59 NODE_25704_length_578_cov_1.088692:325-549(+)